MVTPRDDGTTLVEEVAGGNFVGAVRASPSEYVLGFHFDVKLGRILLVLKDHPAWQAGRLNGVGGKVEAGETPVQAMEREFREEASWDAERGWTQFGRLSCAGGEVYLFHSWSEESPPAHFNRDHEGPGESVRSHYVEDVVLGRLSKGFHTLPGLRWIVPAALNHLRKEDESLLDVREVEPWQAKPW